MNEATSMLQRLQKTGLTVGLIFLGLSGLGAFLALREFLISWLIAFIFWFGLTLGCLLVAMIHYLTGGKWGNLIRRFLEAGYMTLPLMAVLFLPVLMGASRLYPWAQPALVASDKMLQQKAAYDNLPAFAGRAVLFFALWLLLGLRLRKWSLRSDRSPDPAPSLHLRTLSGPGVCLVPLLATFAFIDWIMSLEPAWFSTMFALILLAGQILLAISFGILVLAWLHSNAPLSTASIEKPCRDLGNLLLAFVMFWTYLAFSQFLITYSGNLPHEIDWYRHRIAGGWKWLVAFIALFHFFFPFWMLLLRTVKLNIRRLAGIAALLFLVHVLEIFWIIMPAFFPTGVHVHWFNFTVWLGMGGLWLAAFALNLKRHPLLALHLAPIETPLPRPAHAQ